MSEHELAGENAPPWVAFALSATGAAAVLVAAQLLLMAASMATPPAQPTVAAAQAPVPSAAPEPSVPRTAPEQPPPAASGNTAQQPAVTEARESARPDSRPRGGCPPLFIARFPRGSATPQGAHLKQQVRALADWLTERAQATVVIAGHADANGTERRNLALSFRRAKAVAALLAAAGVASTQLTARAFGEYQPLSGLSEQSAPNRRVEMQVGGFEHCSAQATKGSGT